MLTQMSLRNIALVGVAIAAVAAVVLLASSGEDRSPEEQVRAALLRARQAAEAQDLAGLMAVVSKRVVLRRMDRDELKGFLFAQLRRGQWRKVFLLNTVIRLDPTEASRHATVETDAVLASGAALTSLAQLAGTDAAAYSFDLRLELEADDEWRVVRGDYERVGLAELLDSQANAEAP